MTRSISLKSLEEGMESLDIELSLDREKRLVTLHMLEFEAGHVASFLTQSLPREFGIRVDDSPVGHVPTLPRYDLVIALAGRHHPARLAHLSDGRVAIRLLDPDATYLMRCQRAIEQVLSMLNRRGIEAVVAGIDHYGRPEPNEGFLHVFVRTGDDAQLDTVHQLCQEVGQEHAVDLCPLRFSRPFGDTDWVIAREPHFAWDAAMRKVVLRNWSEGT
jgi:hypothetical protein